MRSSLFRVLTCAIALSMFATSSFAAIETNVSTVAELVGALNYINSLGSKNRANTIKLAPGNYDVSECAMTSDYSDDGTGSQTDKKTHLAMNYVTIVGATVNPRDTVIYGGGEAKSRGVLCGRYSTVRDLTISNGWASSASGGGCVGYNQYNLGTEMTLMVSNCVLTCCHANGSYHGGGAVSWAEVLDSELCGNETTGSNCFGAANKCNLYRCFVHSNSSGSRGGGLGQCYAYDCVISNNTSASGGGGMGVASSSYKYRLQGCVVVGNSASSYGGGLYTDPNADGFVTNTQFISNSGFNRGGGVYGAKCYKCVISNNTVVANSSNNAYGGGADSCRLFDCDICFNSLPERATNKGDSYGAGAYSSTLTRCNVFGNAILEGGSNRFGAGLYSCAATNSVIYENYSAKGSNGAGMNGGTAYGCVFSNNQANATWSGGQIRQPTGSLVNCDLYSQAVECSADIRIENCRFRGYGSWRIPAGHNVASMASDLSGSDPVTPYLCSGNIHMRNCLITGNTASYICKAYDSGKTVFENCTFADNTLTGTFYGFDGDTDSAKAADVVNCVFTRNYKQDTGARCDFRFGSGSNITLRNCLIGESREGTPKSETGTVTADSAKFNEGSDTDPYEIKRGSPAFGAGLVLDWMTAEATDVRGKSEYPRLRDGQCDIGCYQCWIEPLGFLLMYR